MRCQSEQHRWDKRESTPAEGTKRRQMGPSSTRRDTAALEEINVARRDAVGSGGINSTRREGTKQHQKGSK